MNCLILILSYRINCPFLRLVFEGGLDGFASVRGIGGRLGVTDRIAGLEQMQVGVEDAAVEGLVFGFDFDFGVR